MATWQVFEALKWASSFLKTSGREEKAAEILLCYHLQMDRTKLLQNMREFLPERGQERFVRDVYAHGQDCPVQYLTGEETFYGRSFLVNRDVLIPRSETEELVALVLEKVKDGFPAERRLRVADIGTGSGAIAVTLALENPRLSLFATDVSAAALQIAAKNAEKLEASVRFFEGDLLAPLITRQRRFDVIVANPPYIPTADFYQMDPLVADQEPRKALNAGSDGLDFYRRLRAQLSQVIASPALVAFEVGDGQGVDVARMFEEQFGNRATMAIKKDMNGKERMVLAHIS